MVLNKIHETAQRVPQKTALRFAEGDGYRTYSYRDLARIVGSVAGAFAARGIRKGDRVAIFSENRPEWFFAYLATVSLGAVVVPLDAQLTDREAALLLKNAEAKAVCVSASCRSKLPADGSFPVFSFDPSGGLSFAEMMNAGRPAPAPPALSPSDLAALLYTSGTTSDPKGVMLTQWGLLGSLLCGLLPKSHKSNQ